MFGDGRERIKRETRHGLMNLTPGSAVRSPPLSPNASLDCYLRILLTFPVSRELLWGFTSKRTICQEIWIQLALWPSWEPLSVPSTPPLPFSLRSGGRSRRTTEEGARRQVGFAPRRHLSSILAFSDPLTGYLRGLGQQRITFDIQQMLMSDAGLRFAAQQHYLSGRPGKVVDANGGGGSSGDFSDLEDFDY